MVKKNYDSIIESLREMFFCLVGDEELSLKEKEDVFQSFFSVLKKRGVIKADGSLERWRLAALQYLEAIMPKISIEDLLSIHKEEFFNKFVFAPTRQVTSLYWELQGCNGYFKNIPILDVYSEYEEVYGKSPYEKAENGEIRSFLHHVDRVALYSLD